MEREDARIGHPHRLAEKLCSDGRACFDLRQGRKPVGVHMEEPAEERADKVQHCVEVGLALSCLLQ